MHKSILPFKKVKTPTGTCYVQMTKEEYYDSKRVIPATLRQKHLILSALRMMSGKSMTPEVKKEVEDLIKKIENIE